MLDVPTWNNLNAEITAPKVYVCPECGSPDVGAEAAQDRNIGATDMSECGEDQCNWCLESDCRPVPVDVQSGRPVHAHSRRPPRPRGSRAARQRAWLDGLGWRVAFGLSAPFLDLFDADRSGKD